MILDPVIHLRRSVPSVPPGQQLAVSLVAPPATGKTTFALALCDRIGAIRVNGDSTKARMWGDVSRANRRDGREQQRHDQAYAVVYRRAELALRTGQHLVRDYQHNTALERERARALADAYGAYHVLVWLQVPTDVAVTRHLNRRRHRPDSRDTVDWNRAAAQDRIRHSEAKLALEPPPPPRCVRLDATRAPNELVTDFLTAIGYQFPASSNASPARATAERQQHRGHDLRRSRVGRSNAAGARDRGRVRSSRGGGEASSSSAGSGRLGGRGGSGAGIRLRCVGMGTGHGPVLVRGHRGCRRRDTAGPRDGTTGSPGRRAPTSAIWAYRLACRFGIVRHDGMAHRARSCRRRKSRWRA